MRLILCTGGGGAGVTTFAAATALTAAQEGLRVRLASAEDEALTDILRSPETDLLVAPPALTRFAGARGDIGELGGWLAALARWAGMDPAVAAEPWRLPGLRALAATIALLDDPSACDLAVVDMGPSTEALIVLHLLCAEPADAERPSALIRRGGTIVARLLDLPLPNPRTRDAGQSIAVGIGWLRAALRDGVSASVRVVLPADGRRERIEREARTVTGLHGISLDAFVVRGGNADADAAAESSPPEASAGESALGTNPYPNVGDSTIRFFMPWSKRALVGVAALTALGADAYAIRSPGMMLAPLRAPCFELTDSGADLLLPIPARPAEEFAVSRRDGRLTIRAGMWQRDVRLPAAVAALAGQRAWHDGAAFRVRFG